MTAPRQVHNPGSVLMLPMTADAVRLIIMSLREGATQAASQCVDASSKDGPKSKRASMFSELARRRTCTADELALAMNTMPSERLIGYPDGTVLIGRKLDDVRLGMFHEDLAELDRRATGAERRG